MVKPNPFCLEPSEKRCQIRDFKDLEFVTRRNNEQEITLSSAQTKRQTGRKQKILGWWTFRPRSKHNTRKQKIPGSRSPRSHSAWLPQTERLLLAVGFTYLAGCWQDTCQSWWPPQRQAHWVPMPSPGAPLSSPQCQHCCPPAPTQKELSGQGRQRLLLGGHRGSKKAEVRENSHLWGHHQNRTQGAQVLGQK